MNGCASSQDPGPWRRAPEYAGRPDVAAQAGAICARCAGQHPHRGVSEASIGGAATRTTWDLHEVPVAGGIGLEECLAATLWEETTA